MLRLAHSPDPDDAFMWWPLLDFGSGPAIDTGRFRFETVAEDIERLNERSEQAEFEITALSCAQCARVADRYALTACGASMGDGYGPKLVAREPWTIDALRAKVAAGGVRIAVPGVRTSAFGTTSLLLGAGRFDYEPVSFETIIERVADGTFDAGVVIHEGQLTFADAGLHLVADLGAWWRERTGLLLPLGVNAIRRDLENAHGPGTLAEITAILLRSVQHALQERTTSVDYALGFARDMGAELADEFIALYVNRWTLDFGDDGQAAVRAFLEALHAAGLGADPGRVDFIDPA